MANVILKKGLYASLPNSADSNVLLFCTDVGRLFQGTGIGNPLLEYSDIITGYSDLTALQKANPSIEKKIYITNDGKLYIYSGGIYVSIGGGDGHTHENKIVLDKLTQDIHGNLLYNGNPIISGDGHTHENKIVLDKLTQGTDGELLYNGKAISSGSTVVGDTIILTKRIRLNVDSNGQTEFVTTITPNMAINDIELSMIIRGVTYIEEVTGKINPSGQLVITFSGTDFQIETTDDVYLVYTQKEIVAGTVDVDLTGYMDKKTYESDVNVGNVKKSDSSLKIEGVNSSNPLTYYGKDSSGKIGFHAFPVDANKDGEVQQKVLLNVTNGSVHSIPTIGDITDGKSIIQAYKFVQGEQNVIRTIKEFNNGEEENFYCDKSNISFKNGCSINSEFLVKKNDGISAYNITETISKTKFNGDIYLEVI